MTSSIITAAALVALAALPAHAVSWSCDTGRATVSIIDDAGELSIAWNPVPAEQKASVYGARLTTGKDRFYGLPTGTCVDASDAPQWKSIHEELESAFKADFEPAAVVGCMSGEATFIIAHLGRFGITNGKARYTAVLIPPSGMDMYGLTNCR